MLVRTYAITSLRMKSSCGAYIPPYTVTQNAWSIIWCCNVSVEMRCGA